MGPISSFRMRFPAERSSWGTAALFFLAFFGKSAWTQEAVSAAPPDKPSLTVEARLSLTETFTTNGKPGSANPKADQITDVSPGVHLSSEGNRIKGYLDYSLSGLTYAQGSSGNSRRQSLNASGTFVALDQKVFVDVSGLISQQAVSAFGTQAVDSATNTTNFSETSNFRVSPYLRGRFGDTASYELRYGLTSTKTASGTSSDSTTMDWSLQISGGTAFKNLQWSTQATRQSVNYELGRATETDQLRASASYAVSPQVSWTVIGGWESNNFNTVDKDGHTTFGLGANWVLSDATKLSLTRENRYFGESHNLSFEHRTGRTVWRFSDSRSVSTSSQAATASLGSVYDLYFSQFESIEPDPAKRAQLVNDFLLANGINPAGTVSRSYLTSAVSLQRQQSLSFALLGVRDTVTVQFNRSEGSRLDTLAAVNDDFSAASVVRQLGLSVNYAHRLTPDANLNVTLAQQNSSGSTSLQDTSLKTLLVNVSNRLGAKTTASLGLRRATFDSSTTPYGETAITGNLNMRF